MPPMWVESSTTALLIPLKHTSRRRGDVDVMDLTPQQHFYCKRDTDSNSVVSETMKHYCGNRNPQIAHGSVELLTDDIEIPSPCNVCKQGCSCSTCSTASPPLKGSPCTSSETTCTYDHEPLSHQQQKTLQHLLVVYRDGQCSGSDKLLFGKEIPFLQMSYQHSLKMHM